VISWQAGGILVLVIIIFRLEGLPTRTANEKVTGLHVSLEFVFSFEITATDWTLVGFFVLHSLEIPLEMVGGTFHLITVFIQGVDFSSAPGRDVLPLRVNLQKNAASIFLH